MYTTLSEFYKSQAWRLTTASLKAERTNGEGFIICEHCGQPIVKAYDCIVHHKDPLTLANVNVPEIALNPKNLALLHHRCHNEVHNRFGLYMPQKVVIVHGAPLSGKTTFVQENKSDRDLIVDIDRIWQCITMDPPYIKNNYLKANVFEVRNALIEQVRMRQGKWQTAWIIGTYPRSGERERLADRLGAELIHIDTTQAECMERLHKAGDRDINLWTGYIENYFKCFS